MGTKPSSYRTRNNRTTMTIAQRLRNLYDNLVLSVNFINNEITRKADKVFSVTAGNFAGLDSTGNLTDSGKKASDFATAAQGAKADTALQEHQDISGKADKVVVVTQTTSATIAPNTFNVWSSVSNDLTITKGNDISGIVNEYIIRLTLDSSWVKGTNTITFNGFALEWNGGSVPTWTAGHIYEISIVDNIALWADITPAS